MEMKVLGGALLLASIFDIKNKKIPNYFNLIFLIIGIGFSIIINNISIIKNLEVLFFTFLCAYPIYHFNVLGAGDVKLFICSRFFLGHYSWLMLISISLCVGGLIFLGRLWYAQELDFKTRHYFRFTPYILLAYVILLVFLKK
jgi:Flp pilus assembly protein protease CpaA